MNITVISGNLTRDPELRHTPKGMAIADVSLAVNDRVKSGDEWKDDTSYIDVTVFGKTAENLKENVAKGDQLHVQGRLKQETWEAQDGAKRSKIKVVADKVEWARKASGSQRPQRESKGSFNRNPDDEIAY